MVPPETFRIELGATKLKKKKGVPKQNRGQESRNRRPKPRGCGDRRPREMGVGGGRPRPTAVTGGATGGRRQTCGRSRCGLRCRPNFAIDNYGQEPRDRERERESRHDRDRGDRERDYNKNKKRRKRRV